MGVQACPYTKLDQNLLAQIKELVKQAHIVTPNLTEICLLTGISYESLLQHTTKTDFLQAIQDAGQQLQIKTDAHIIITGIHSPYAQNDAQVI